MINPRRYLQGPIARSDSKQRCDDQYRNCTRDGDREIWLPKLREDIGGKSNFDYVNTKEEKAEERAL